MRYVLALLFALLTQAAPAAPLPPVPDSLQPALAQARTAPARQAVLLRIAYAYGEAMQEAGAVGYTLAAERLARQQADSLGVGRAVLIRGHYYQQVADQTRAQPLLERAARLLAAAPLPDRAELAFCLGWLYGDLNQSAKALRYLRQADALFGQVPNRARQAEVLSSFVVPYLYDGHSDSAALVMLRAVDMLYQLGDQSGEAGALGNLAMVLYQQDHWAEAGRYARRAYALLRQTGDKEAQPAVLQTLGEVALKRDSLPLALSYFRSSLRLLRQTDNTGNQTTAYGALATTFSRLKQHDSAVYYQRAAVALARRLHQTTGLGIEVAALARVYLDAGRLDEAAQAARQAIAAQQGQQLQLDRPLFVLEKVAELRGDFREALRLTQQLLALEKKKAQHDNDAQVSELRTRFDTDRAEQQVALLEKDRELARLRTQQQLTAATALGLLLLAAATALLWRYRRRQRQRDHALRQQIAADLHDDVGSLLTQISLQSELLSQGIYGPEQQPRYLAHMAEASRNAVRQMSDVVWGLQADPAADSLASLLNRLREHTHEVLASADIESEFTTEPGLESLAVALPTRQALYLIYKEALHNVVKHAAGATEVSIRLRRAAGPALHLEVRDNGTGPAPTARPWQPSGSGGNGLRNMQARALAVGGAARGTATAEGFRVEATLPLG